MEETARKVRKE